VQESTHASDWSAVTVAFAYTCAVKTDGTLWCWGNNANGQLGDGTTTDSSVPVQVTG
jgi:alpha-tubulin suppressor-like RCC1 family protein